jgi:hypothetical protein
MQAAITCMCVSIEASDVSNFYTGDLSIICYLLSKFGRNSCTYYSNSNFASFFFKRNINAMAVTH